MADDWLTSEPEPAAADDWLTSEPEPDAGAGATAVGDDDDWLASTLEFSAAEVLYGSPCGAAVRLDEMYWCEETRKIISEQCTAKEIESFLSPDCNQIYSVENAEVFQNKSLNSFVCPRCPCTLTTMKEDALGYYLYCSFCRWDSTSLVVEALGGKPFTDEKPDKLILRLMGLEKESPTDAAMKTLLGEYQDDLAPAAQTQHKGPRGYRPDSLGRGSVYTFEELHKKLESAKLTPQARMVELFEALSVDGKLDREGVSALSCELNKPLKFTDLEAAMKAMDSGGIGKVTLDQVTTWWQQFMEPQRGLLPLGDLLLQDAHGYADKLQKEPSLLASLPQRFMQPSVQPDLVQQLLPRRKALIPRICRRSIYSQRFVVKPQNVAEGGGGAAKNSKEEPERKFEVLELGVEYVPRFYVAELPDAEGMKSRPTPLMLTVTNPLDTECTLRFRDCAVAAAGGSASADLLPDEPLPGKHKARGDADFGVNAQLSMVDGKAFAELKIAAAPISDTSAPVDDLLGDDDVAEDSSCVVLRSGNRVTIQFFVKSLAQSFSNAKCGLHCEMTTPDMETACAFTTYFLFSVA